MANEYLRPTTSDYGNFTNASYAYDGSGTGDNSTYASETAGDTTEIWRGFASAGQTYTALTLHIIHEFTGNAGNDQYTLSYSLDGGNSWETPIKSGVPTAYSKVDTSITLSASQNTSQIQVKAFFDKVGGGDSGIEARIWEIYTDGEYGISRYGEVAITPSTILEIDGTVTSDATASDIVSSSTLKVHETIEYKMGFDTVLGACAITSSSTVSTEGGIGDGIEFAGISITSSSILKAHETIEYPMYNGIKFGACSIENISSTAVAIGQKVLIGATVLAVAATMAAAGKRDIHASSDSLVATSSMSISSQCDRHADCSLLSGAALSVAGDDTNTLGQASIVSLSILIAHETIEYDMGDPGAAEYGELSISSSSTLGVDSAIDRPGDLAISSASSMGADAYRDRNGLLNISSSSALAVDSTVDRNSASALSTTVTLTVSGERDRETSADLSSNTILVSIGSRGRTGAILASTDAVVIATAGRDREAFSDLDTTSTLTSVSCRDRNAALSVASSSLLDADSIIHSVDLGKLSIYSSSALDVDGEKFGIKAGQASLFSTSVTGGEAQRDREASAEAVSTTLLTAIPEVTGIKPGRSSISSSSSIVSLASVDRGAKLSASSSSSLGADSTVYSIDFGKLNIYSSAALSIDGEKFGVKTGESILSTTSALVAKPKADRNAYLGIYSDSVFGAFSVRDRFTQASLSSDTSLSVKGIREKYSGLTISSVSASSAEAHRDRESGATVVSTTLLTAIPEVTGVKPGRSNISSSSSIASCNSLSCVLRIVFISALY